MMPVGYCTYNAFNNHNKHNELFTYFLWKRYLLKYQSEFLVACMSRGKLLLTFSFKKYQLDMDKINTILINRQIQFVIHSIAIINRVVHNYYKSNIC